MSGHARPALPTSAAGLAPLGPDFWPTIDDGLARMGIALSDGARRAIDAHARLLMAWNAAINLTALRTPAAIARGHVLDSLLPVPALRALLARSSVDESAGASLLDLGSGGGYPGLPLACALPVRRVALVDSIAKKARFLAVAAAAVAAEMADAGHWRGELTALAERAEDLADEPDHREAWDLVAARAVGSVSEVAELGLPLARVGGCVVVWKHDAGDGALDREIAASSRASAAVGGARPRLLRLAPAEEVGLPGHCLVVLRKQRPTPLRYPRPAGERRRHLLG